MGGEQRTAPNFKENFETEAQQEERLRDEGGHNRNTEEIDRSESRQTNDGGASQTISAVASSGTGTVPPLLPACDADDAKTSWKEYPCAPEARAGEYHSARITSNDSRNRAFASTVGEGTDKEKDEQHSSGSDVHPACDEAEKPSTGGKTKEEQQAGPRVKGRLDVATVDTVGEAPQVEEATPGGDLSDCVLSTICGTRAECVACTGCRRYFYLACGANLQVDTDGCAQGLCRACRADGSSERENSLREIGMKKGAQEQRFVDTLGRDMQTELAEEARSKGNKRGDSDGRGGAKVERAVKPAADSRVRGPGGSKVHADIEALAKHERLKESHLIVDSKELQEKLCVYSEAGGDTGCAACSSASAADVKAETVSSKAERPLKPVMGDTDGVDLERRATKGDSVKSPADNRTYAVEDAPSADHDGKHMDEKGTLTGQSSKGAEHGKSTAVSNKSAAEISIVESSRCGLGSSRSADDSDSGLEASKSATESKERIGATQERRGSGAEDEEEEEEEAELLQGGLSGGSEKKEYMASRKRGGAEAITRGKPTSPRSLSPSPCQYRRKRRRGDNGAVATRCKVNVGPRHQVPALPPFFLDSSCTRDGRADRLPETRELYSHDAGDTARLVYSPFAMQRVYRRRLAEGTTGEGGIRNADEMNDFIRKVAKNWTNKAGWQPFSPEYAYKLLHFAGYDPQRALRIMKDSRFCFTTICDPPQRRYDNKWRPKDRRGQIATHPYPSPLTLRAYLSRRNQHAAATAAADSANSYG